jgi:hypothetical protein
LCLLNILSFVNKPGHLLATVDLKVQNKTLYLSSKPSAASRRLRPDSSELPLQGLLLPCSPGFAVVVVVVVAA